MYKNNIDLIGFFGSDPEARCTRNGTPVTTFSLATKSSCQKKAGSYESRTECHGIAAHIEVEGELRHRAYQHKPGIPGLQSSEPFLSDANRIL